MRLVILLCCATAFFAREANGTIVKLDTPIGSMTFQLYDEAKPLTVANFLSYITSGRFDGSFAHRLPEGFVLQGGAYTVTGGNIGSIPTYAPVVNEAGPFPQYSNVMGTIVMAKLPGDPNSATSSWFVNLRDNNTGTADQGNLDLQNGGFTVFGAVIEGMDVLQTFVDFNPWGGGAATNVIVNASGGNPNSPFTTLPVTEMDGSGTVHLSDLIYTTWTVVPEPSTAALAVAAVALILLRRFPRRPRLPSRGGSALR